MTDKEKLERLREAAQAVVDAYMPLDRPERTLAGRTLLKLAAVLGEL